MAQFTEGPRRWRDDGLRLLPVAATAQWVLLLWLVPAHGATGATGAAFAHAISMCGMYGAFGWIAHREPFQFRR